MGRVYKNYTKELKEQACKLVVEKNIPVRIVVEKLSVRVQLLYKWLNQYESYGQEAFVGSGRVRSADTQLKKLQKENKYLKLENEVLKKQRHTLRKSERMRQNSKKIFFSKKNKHCMSDTRRIA